jgi:ribosomal protein S18 acetylase RimI-like enzyme
MQLRPLREDEFEAWYPAAVQAYAESLARDGGRSPDLASAKAAEDSQHLFPGGRPSPGHVVYAVEVDGEAVGTLWVAAPTDGPQAGLFIWDILIYEQHRGRGYGKAAMLLAEEEARRRGLDRISLNVFGDNTLARNLYRSLGYRENAIAMSKRVEPR